MAQNQAYVSPVSEVVGLTVNIDIFNLSVLVTPNTNNDAYTCLEGRFNIGRQVKKFPGVDVYVNVILFPPTHFLDSMLTLS